MALGGKPRLNGVGFVRCGDRDSLGCIFGHFETGVITMSQKANPKTGTGRTTASAKTIVRKVARSAKSGLFVTEEFARRHPSTTEIETINVERSKLKKKS
jgi:hypothetical protein